MKTRRIPGKAPRWYGLAELEALPTLSVAQADSLKVDDGEFRIWLCRCGVADGMPYDHQVSVERCIDGKWTVIETYQAQ